MSMSQENIILEYLKSGKSLTPMDALTLCNCWALSSRISEIRKKYPSIDIQVDTIHDEATGKHYAKYYIPREAQMEMKL